MNQLDLLRFLPREAIRQMEKPTRVRTQAVGAHQAHQIQQSESIPPNHSIQIEGRYVSTSMTTGRNGRARFREQSGDVIDLGTGGEASYWQKDKGANGFVNRATRYRIHNVTGIGEVFFSFDGGGGTMHRPAVGGNGVLARIGSFIGRCVVDPKTGDVKKR